MSRTIRALSAVLAGALLAVTLVAFTPGDVPEAKATLGPLQAVTLTAAEFQPQLDETDFFNAGVALASDGVHLARIHFPAETVVVTSVKIRVYDNVAADLCVTLYRAVPGEASESYLGFDCTSGESTQYPQTLSITAFKRIGRYHTAYLWASFGAKTGDLSLFGATVFYRVVT